MTGNAKPPWRGNYDERQMRIRGDCFQHGFIALCLALILEPALGAGETRALPVGACHLALFVGIAVVSTEMIARGVYFGLARAARRNLSVLLVVAVLSYWVVTASRAATGPLWSSGRLADAGYMLAAAVAMTAIPVALAFRALADRAQAKRED
jgi:hypothetical protein